METYLDKLRGKNDFSTWDQISFPDYPIKFWYCVFRKTILFLLTVSLEFVIHATILYMRLPLAKGGPAYNKMTFKTTSNRVRLSLHFKKVLQFLTPVLKATFVTSMVQGTIIQDWKFFDLRFSTDLNSKCNKRFGRIPQI